MRNTLALSLALLGLTTALVSGNPHSHQLYHSKNLITRREVKKGHFGATEIAEYPQETDGVENIKM
jgi:hypothetical protein